MPAQVFASGFEGGSYAADGWDSTTVTGAGQSLTITAPARRSGTQGSRSILNSTAADQNHEAKATKLIPDTPNQKAYAQTWVRLMSVSSVGYGAIGSKGILALRALDGQPLVWLSMRSGGVIFSYMGRNNAIVAINPFIPLTTGQWYGFRLLLDRSGFNPYIEGWFSTDGVTWSSLGSAVAGLAGTSGVAKRPGSVDVGIVHIINFETGSYTINHDDVEIGHSIAGTEWSAIFSGRVKLISAVRGQQATQSLAQGRLILLGGALFRQDRAGQFMVVGRVVGHALGQIAVESLAGGFVHAGESDILVLVERAGRAFWTTRVARIFTPAGSATVGYGSSSLGFWLMTRVLTEVGIPTPVITASLSQQMWGAAVTSDEEHGAATISDQPVSVTVISDEKG